MVASVRGVRQYISTSPLGTILRLFCSRLAGFEIYVCADLNVERVFVC